MIFKNLVRAIIITGLAGVISCDESGSKDLTREFNYPVIIDREYSNFGRTIPLTIDQGIENDGFVTADGKYFIYSSDREGGNFDIYLRGMKDISTARIISHPGKDTSPALSPDGKTLAFVSNREDPEGDIYVVSLNPGSILNSVKKSLSWSSTLDRGAKNLTQYQHPETKTIMIVRDANPVWSPDGKYIAFSSRRDGDENIWIMNKSGKNLKKITEKGGLYPSFSPDGKEIAFVSYRERSSNGDIYTVNIETGEEKQVTSSPALDLYPSYAGVNSSIIFSRIDKDTNSDSKIDLNDASYLVYLDIVNGDTYPLTFGRGSSFNGRWSPAFKSDYSDGVVVYSELYDGNININLIPDSGLIPKRKNAIEQLDLAASYLRDLKDEERFILAVDRVYYYFHKDESPESAVSVARSIIYGWEKSSGRESENYYKRLKSFAALRGGYSEAAMAYLDAIKVKSDGVSVLESYLDKFKDSEVNQVYVPYIMEDLAEIYLRKREYSRAEKIYSEIISAYPDLSRINHLKRNYLQAYTSARGVLPDSVSEMLNTEDYRIKTRMKLELHRFFTSALSKTGGKELLSGYRETFIENKTLVSVIDLALFEYSVVSGGVVQAAASLSESLKNIIDEDKDIIYYRSCLALGDHYVSERNRPSAEIWFYEGVSSYKREWTDANLGKRLNWLIAFYEEFGERAHFAADHKEAVALYKKYSVIMSRVSSIREYNELYNKYSPRAHVLYIDEYVRLRGAKRLRDLQLEYEKNQIRAQIEFDKAFIYGLGYIYMKRGMAQEKKKEDDTGDPAGVSGLVEYFKRAVNQTEWAVFMDDTFVEPYILKSYLFQYLDLKRSEEGDEYDDKISRVFPKYLWEKNISILERALAINDGVVNPDNEGAIHLNMANNYYLLNNYPRAQVHYEESKKYKNRFGSQLEEALFHFHLSQCYWHNGKPDLSREQLQITLNIYESLATGKNRKRYSNQLFTVYKYFALMLRSEGKYTEAINWYIRILEFAASNKMKIDRARFLQEIAHCYMELEDYDRALSYIDQAGRQLKKYSDDDRRYNVRFRLLERWTLFSFDLGPDAAVVGNNKIFSSLGKTDKQALNYSLLEEVYFRKNSYTRAQDFLKKKIELHEKRGLKVDKEATVVALNNTAFYSIRMKKYIDAEKNYIRARKIAAANEDLEGEFRSIINLTNLYSFVVDNGLSDIKNPAKSIENLIKIIDDYKNDFKDEKYKIEYEQLAAEAKVRKVDVSKDDIDKLKAAIDAEAEEIYFIIGISRGVLEFYLAETLRPERFEVSENIKDAKKYYEKPSRLFSLYSSALNNFTSSLDSKHKRLTGDLRIRVLLNAAESSYSLGLYDKTTAYLKEANDLAAVYEIPVLQMNALLSLARFELNRNGNAAAAKQNLDRAAKLVEENPVFFASSMKRVRELYDLSAILSLRTGRYNEAFSASERYSSVSRIVLVYLSGADFKSESENIAYEKYMSAVKSLNNAISVRTGVLNAAEPPESERYISANENLAAGKKNYIETVDMIFRSEPGVKYYIRTEEPKLQAPAETSVVRLLPAGKGVSVLVLTGGQVSAENLDSVADLAAWLEKKAESTIRPYLIVEESLVEYHKTGLLNLKGYYLVNSVSDIQRFKNNSNPLVASVYFTGSGIKSILEPQGLVVTEGGKAEDLSSYSVVIDAGSKAFLSRMNIFGDGSGGSAVDNADLFGGRKVRPVLIVKEISAPDADYIRLFLEGAIYTGASTVVFTVGGNATQYASVVQSFLEGTSPEAADPKKIILAGGHPYISSGTGDILSGALETEKRLYNEKLLSSDFDEALFRLNRWRDLARTRAQRDASAAEIVQDEIQRDASAAESVQDEIQRDASAAESVQDEIERDHHVNLADLLALSEKYDESLKIAAQGAKLLPENDPRQAKLDSLTAYALIQKGKIEDAEDIIKKYLSDQPIEGTPVLNDFMIMKAILTALSGSREDSYKIFSEAVAGGEFFINRMRMTVFYASVLKAAGYDTAADSAMKLAGDHGQIRSVRDSVFVNYMTGAKVSGAFSMRIKRILAAGSSSGEKLTGAGALQMALVNSTFDSVSVFPVATAISRAIAASDINAAQNIVENINAADMVATSGWIDSVSFLRLVQSVYAMNSLHEESLVILAAADAVLKPIDDTVPALMKNHYFRYGLAYLSMGDYAKGYDMFMKGDKLFSEPSGSLYNSYTMLAALCEIRLKSPEKALERLNGAVAGGNLTKSDSFIFKLLTGGAAANVASGKSDLTVPEIDAVTGEFNQAFAYFNADSVRDYTSVKAIEESIDEYIRMLTANGRFGQAVLAADIKRTVLAAVATSDRAIKVNPELDMELFRGKLNSDTLFLYFMKLGNDLHIISADSSGFNGALIPESVEVLNTIMDDYSEALSRLANTLQISIRLYELLEPLNNMIKDKKRIIISTDSVLSDLPYELIGERELLGERYSLLYASGLNFTADLPAAAFTGVSVSGEDHARIYKSLEVAALKRLALHKPGIQAQGSAYVMYHHPLSYNYLSASVNTRGRSFTDTLSTGTEVVYLSAVEFYGVGINELVILAGGSGVKKIVVNDSYLHDVNNAVFVESFYRNLKKGIGVAEAFEAAKNSVKSRRESKHPAYWAGIRLYIN